MHPVAFIPSPSQGVWHLGPIPIRAYAIMIILGIVVAVWVGERRWAAKGGSPGVIIDVAVWAVPFGLVGGRLYHVITDAQRYFGTGGDPVRALEIWKGGLGIWGAIALGAVGAYIGCRRRGISILALADACAPGIVLAQAVGRWGNYWNQELYGKPLHAFWALKIDPSHRPTLGDGPALNPKYENIGTYHPTFLYESLWCIGVAILIIWADRRYKLTHGRAFALYVAAYTVGRGWVEALRIDDAHHFLGMRLNDYTSIVLFLGAVAYLYFARTKTGPEAVVGHAPGAGPEPASDGSADGGAEDAAPTAESAEAAKPEDDEPEDEQAKAEDPEAEGPEAEGPEAGEPQASDDAEPEPAAETAETAGEEPEAAVEADEQDSAPEQPEESTEAPQDAPASEQVKAEAAPAEAAPAEREAAPEPEAEPAEAAAAEPEAVPAAATGQNEADGAAGTRERVGKGEPVRDGK